MRKLTFVNAKGKQIVLGNSAPYLVTKLEGVGAAPGNIQTQKSPYQDGVTYIDTTLESRQITIEGAILQRNPEQIFRFRQELLSVLNPKLGKGILTYEYDGGSKQIECVVDDAPVFPDKQQGVYQRFLINLLCPNPFWLDTFIESEEMADWLGGLAFTLMLPTMFAGRSTRLNKVIQNKGDVETPLTFEFPGPCLNPKVINADTGEFIKVNRYLAANEKLIITTEFGNKRVTLQNLDDGTTQNAFNFIDINSSFFQLQPGDNQLSYDADQGKETAKVVIRWRNRYLGV